MSKKRGREEMRMPPVTTAQIIQYISYLLLLIIAAALEYFKLLPTDSTAGVFLLIVGHFFGNIPTSNALARSTQAPPPPDTSPTETTLQAPQGPIHLIHHYETPPVQSSPPVPTTEPIDKTPTGPIPVVNAPINFGETAKVPAVGAQ